MEPSNPSKRQDRTMYKSGTPNQIHSIGYFEICQICGWEDDPLQREYPDEPGPNKMTFNEGKQRWENGETLFEGYPNPRKVKPQWDVASNEKIAV